MYDVVTVGSAVLDILLKSSAFKLVESKKIVGGKALCEIYGGKIEAEQIEVSSGGGGTNNAVSFARKGLKTAIIAEMGEDIVGRMIISELVREGVETDFLVVEEGEETGISVILVSSDGERSIVTYRGASRMLTSKDINWSKLRTRWMHISSLGGRLSLFEELCKRAKQMGIKVAVNPGKLELRERKRLWECVKGVEVLILNREEASELSQIDFSDDRIFRSDSCLVGPRVSVITAGKNGGKVCYGGNCSFYSGSNLKVVSNVGAGDAFGSGLVSGLIYRKGIEEAIEWGRKNAESVLTSLSAKKGLLRLSELANS